ncbi:MAG: glycosyltransferase [Saprospiraceae bacterium]|nr:glycosyltransferase [Saprospiraceae bacterium]
MKPLFSIITVVYNAADLLEGTILSVIEQSYPRVEYIIIDGGSTDGSIDIITKYSDHLSYWTSEPDKGLYDAMNKGIAKAKGDYLWFMNAGDHIRKKSTLEQMVENWNEQVDILYGEVMLVDEERKEHGLRSEKTAQRLPDELSWKSLKLGMCVSHQGFLPKRKIAPQYQMGNLSADIDWVIQCLKNASETRYVGFPIADYLMGGVSKKRHKQSLKDRFWILSKHYGFFQNLVNHLVIAIRALWLKVIGKTSY